MDQEQEETRQEEEEEEISDEEDCEHSSKDSIRLQLPLEQAEEPEDSHTGHSDNGEYIHKIIDSSNNSDCDDDNDNVVDRVVLGDYVENVVIKEEDVDAPDASIKEEDIVPEEPRRVSWTGRAVVACLLLGWGVFLTYCYLTLSPTCTPVTLHCPDPTITFTAQVGYLHIYTISIIYLHCTELLLLAVAAPGGGGGARQRVQSGHGGDGGGLPPVRLLHQLIHRRGRYCTRSTYLHYLVYVISSSM